MASLLLTGVELDAAYVSLLYPQYRPPHVRESVGSKRCVKNMFTQIIIINMCII